MKILHFADLHLDCSFANLGLPASIGQRRRHDLRHLLVNIFDIALEHQVDAITIAGDLFDNNTVLAETLSLLTEQIDRFAPKPVLVSPGNSDYYDNQSLYDIWRFPDNFHVFANDEPTIFKISDDFAIWGLAYREGRKADLMFKKLRAETACDILLTYEPLISEKIISLSEIIGNSPFNYGLFGGNHTYQENPDGVMAGSPECLDLNPQLHQHGVVIIEFLDQEAKPEFIATGRWQVVNQTFNLTELETMPQLEDAIHSVINETTDQQTYHEITLVGSPSFVVNREQLADTFLDKARFRLKLDTPYDLVELEKEPTVRGLLIKQSMEQMGSLKSIDDTKTYNALHLALRAMDGIEESNNAKEQGLNLYRALLTNAATKTRPDGGAFNALLERWISDLQQQVMRNDGIQPNDPTFARAVDERIHATVSQMEGMVHGFDFSTVISAYWHGHQSGDDDKKEAAMRWLRGEYSTKTEAREALGVRVIIDDNAWYDYIKLLANFVKDIGYKGLIIFVDEAVNLYKISHTVSRNNNYERLLTIFNDTMQGKAQHLGVIIGATPQMVEDTRRGLFSYEALRTRLEESRFSRNGLRDLSGPMIRLDVLTPEEIFVLLQRIREIHELHHKYEPSVTDKEIEYFLNEVRKRIGAEQMLTPREVVRDFLAVLNILRQNPDQSFASLVGGEDFKPTRIGSDPEALTPENEIRDEDEDAGTSPYKSFEL